MKKTLVVLVLAAVSAASAVYVPSRPSVALPPVICAVPGDTCAIYYRNVVDAVRPESYGYLVSCKVGRNDGTCWTWTPTDADAGRQLLLVLSLVSDEGVKSVATTCVSVVTMPTDRTRPLSLAILADSLTNCRYQDRVLDRMRQAGFTGYRPVGSRTGYSAAPIGTFEPGKAAHDGYGGYSWAGFMNNYAFATDEIDNIQSEAERQQLAKTGVEIAAGSEWRRNLLKSPLIQWRDGKKVVDVQAWFDRINGGKAPDVILVELGGNDVFYRNEDGLDWERRDVRAKVWKEMDVMLDALRAAAPTSLIVLATTPVGGFESGFGDNYGCFRTAFTFRSSAHMYNRMLAEKTAERKDARLVVAPIHHAIDPEKGYPRDNALHLTPEGGDMIGDALYAWLVGNVFAPDRFRSKIGSWESEE